VVIGAPDEAPRARAIAAAGDATFVETPSVRSAFALLAQADHVFTPDTSIAHAASAFGKPAVVMYLADKAALWGLYGAPGENLESPDQSLASLPLEPVLDAVDALLASGAAPARYAM
jgi:ADP-heptose:LPS heptosyltransferase